MIKLIPNVLHPILLNTQQNKSPKNYYNKNQNISKFHYTWY